MDDPCTCGHDRDEHAGFGGVCLAVLWPNRPRSPHCPCGHYEPEQDNL